MENSKLLSILLAEDNPLNSKLAQINIEKMGHHLDIVENGYDAVNKFISNTYDIILMDVDMPVMNGLEATKTIREIERESGNNQKVKIIALTAYGNDEKDSIMRAGMDSFYCKPLRQKDFYTLLA